MRKNDPLRCKMSVRTKVWILMTIAVTIALLISTSALIVQQVHTERGSDARRHGQIARIIAANMGAALIFGDRDAAVENLATVAGIDDVVWVRVIDRQSQTFASYANQGSWGSTDELHLPVTVDGKQVGELRMGVHRLSVGDVIRRIALPASISFAGSLMVALLVAHWLFGTVFRPINRLLDELRRIVSSGDFSARLPPDRAREFRVIGLSFNAVLEEVEARTAALKETAIELGHARDLAEEASIAKSQFLANMSHELRTPLNAIIGYTEVLREELEALGRARSVEDVDWIHSSALQLLELINGILDLSKIEAGKMMLDRHEVDLAKLMREVQATLEPLAAHKHNTLTVQLDPALKVAFTDATKLRQCLLNLGSNACKFTENGHVFIHARAEDEELLFSVSDTGIGMSAEELDRLFQPFVQADASTTRQFGGTGLGLAITLRFAEMLGGHVAVESEPGHGATFTLRVRRDLSDGGAIGAVLPASEPATDLASAALGATAPRLRPLALIVEDEPSSAQLLARLVEQAGYDAISVGDGAEALASAQARRPDLVLLDIGLPTLDGWDVLKAFEDDPVLKAIPTVAVTVDDDRRRIFDAGASEHLVKPVDRTELNAVLAQYAGRSAGAVLIVEDDVATARLWERGVIQMGFTARIVHDGRAALEALARDAFDFVVTDLRMPQVNGFELVAAISAMPAERRPRVLVATGKVLDEEDRRFFDGKGAQLLSKFGLSPRKLAHSISAGATAGTLSLPAAVTGAHTDRAA